MQGGKRLGIHKLGGFTWIPEGLHADGSTRYGAEMICPICKKKRWVLKSVWAHTRLEFTGICRSCYNLSRRSQSNKKKVGRPKITKEKINDFDLFNLIDDRTFSSNLSRMGNYNSSHHACGRNIKERQNAIGKIKKCEISERD